MIDQKVVMVPATVISSRTKVNPWHILFVQFVNSNWTTARDQRGVSFQRLGMTVVTAKLSRHCDEANLVADS
ncbi:MAG: hypothetical protein SH868_18030 [Bythopirellula sp.]|nr:hypothetical protein [Bythopirellula sp.]